MTRSFASLHSEAWRKVGIGNRNIPGEIFPRYTKKDFEDLKTDYVNQYGYTVRIPQWDDIVHLTPNEFKAPGQIKAEKKEALTRILESPAPEWAREYSSVMTWIDNVQDTASLVIPAISMLVRVAPKVFGRLLPIAGWMLLGYDLLNIANAIGRAPLAGLKGKRAACQYVKGNPFTKTAQFLRKERIKNYKPGLSDLIQAAQVLDQFTGAGLSLGGIMGAITDSIFGAYRYLNGEPVKWSFDPPPVDNLQMMGARGVHAATVISSKGQVFSEETHFWTYITASLSSMVTSGFFKDELLTDLVVDPMNMMIPAPEPKDPYTIAVIEEAGLKVEDGIGWPYNGQKFISAGDFIDATLEPCNAHFHAYCLRHSKDSYGFLAAAAMDSLIPQTITAMDPDGEFKCDDTNEMKVFWKMIKGALLPSKPVTKEQGERFMSWVNDYCFQYGKTPGILEIEEKFKMLGIEYKTSYPSTPDPDFLEFWPEGWTGDESI
jgi:hypothetical protein